MEKMVLQGLERFNEEEQENILKAYWFAVKAHAGVKRKSGEEYVSHPIAVAQILIDGHKDCSTVCAGLLHDVIEDTSYTSESILNLFDSKRGPEIVKLVEGVTKVSRRFDMSKQAITYASLRKLMTSCASDVRVVEVKLADRLHNMRTAEFWNEETRQRKILETTEVYIPLAERTGAYRIKNELEDICFKYTYPKEYEIVKQEGKQLMDKYEGEMKDVSYRIQNNLEKEGLESNITYRIKNLYGLYLEFERYKTKKKSSKELSDFPLQINLAISLHAPNDRLRNLLMPISKAYPLKELMEAVDEYILKTNRRVTMEYIMLDNVNDNEKCAKELSSLLRGRNVYVNLIPYNETNHIEFKKSSKEKINAFYDTLYKEKINVTVRREFGSKISAACGQLRSKEV